MITWQDQRREHILHPYTTEEYYDYEYDYLSFLPKARVRFIPSGGNITNGYNYPMYGMPANYARSHPVVAMPPPMPYSKPPQMLTAMLTSIMTSIDPNTKHSLAQVYGVSPQEVIR